MFLDRRIYKILIWYSSIIRQKYYKYIHIDRINYRLIGINNIFNSHVENMSKSQSRIIIIHNNLFCCSLVSE